MQVKTYGGQQFLIADILDTVMITASSKYKNVGIINWWWLNKDQAQIDKLKEFLDTCDICFFISEETFDKFEHIDINDIFTLMSKYNVFYLLFSEDRNLHVQPPIERTICYPWFFKSPIYISKEFRPSLEYVEKPYVFNMLLGAEKPYRNIFYRLLKDNKNIYSSYLGHNTYKNDVIKNLDDKDIADDLTTQNVSRQKLYTMNKLLRGTDRHAISHIVPERIYNNTHFDFVTETSVKCNTAFVTEKTAKPLATGRFFCWYNSNNTREYLEKFGFDFGNYLSEPYDGQLSETDRINGLINIVDEACNNELFVKDIYEKTLSVRIHNMERFKSCQSEMFDGLKEWVTSCLNT